MASLPMSVLYRIQAQAIRQLHRRAAHRVPSRRAPLHCLISPCLHLEKYFSCSDTPLPVGRFCSTPKIESVREYHPAALLYCQGTLSVSGQFSMVELIFAPNLEEPDTLLQLQFLHVARCSRVRVRTAGSPKGAHLSSFATPPRPSGSGNTSPPPPSTRWCSMKRWRAMSGH